MLARELVPWADAGGPDRRKTFKARQMCEACADFPTVAEGGLGMWDLFIAPLLSLALCSGLCWAAC